MHRPQRVIPGETLEEALANMREVIALALEGEQLSELGFVDDPSLLVEVELGPLSRDFDSGRGSPVPGILRPHFFAE